jgi:hypothetical protein
LIFIAVVMRFNIERSKHQEDRNVEAMEHLEKIGSEISGVAHISDDIVFKLIG